MSKISTYANAARMFAPRFFPESQGTALPPASTGYGWRERSRRRLYR